MKAGVWSNSVRGATRASRIFGRSASTDWRAASTTGCHSAGKPPGSASAMAWLPDGGLGPRTAAGSVAAAFRAVLVAVGVVAPAWRRSESTIFSKATQSGISVPPQARVSSAVRITASASGSASASSSASRPSSAAIQSAASITCAAAVRRASSVRTSVRLRNDQSASKGMWRSVKPPRSFMPKWLVWGIAISALSQSEPALERDSSECSRSNSAAWCRSPPLACSRCRLTRFTSRSRAFSSSGRRYSLPK